MAIRKGYVDCSAGQIHYRRVAGEFPMVAFDTPGFGESFDPETPPTMAQYADWLLEAIDGLGLARFHVFGHHTGACLAVELAARHPARTASLMMMGPVPLTAEERAAFGLHFGDLIAPNADGSYLKSTWDYLASLGAGADLELHHRELVDTTRAYLGRSMAYRAVWAQDRTALHRQVRCPLLLCAEDDVLHPYFGRAQEIRPDARAVTLRGANFEPDLDTAGTVSAIRDFLATR